MEDRIIQTDVLIVGGGPAGASTALSLLNYSELDVILVEHSDFSKERIGEHVSPSILNLIDYLKLDRDDFLNDCTERTFGTMSAWGSDQLYSANGIYTPEESTFQLDRLVFDLSLIEAVNERGGQVIPRSKCQKIESLNDDTWKVRLIHEDFGEIQVFARFLIDATGRKASVSRKLGCNLIKHDSLVGIGGFFQMEEGVEVEKYQLLEASSEGWWYSSILPNQLIGVTFFCDSDLVSRDKKNELGTWKELCASTSHIRERVKKASALINGLWSRDAHSHLTDFSEVPNFLPVGDAAVSFDPISSMGIGFAITSACNAARTIRHHFANEDSTAIEQYQSDLKRHFDDYLEKKKSIYEKENRWKDEVFWERRGE